MLKQSLIFLFLSILVVIFARYVHLFVVYIDIFYTYLNVMIAPLFSHSYAGTLTRSVLILLLVPLLIISIPTLVYRLIKGKVIPYYIEATWIIWLIIVISKIMI